MTSEKRPPIIQLLFRSILWTPFALLITVVFFSTICATIISPIVAAIYFFLGEYLMGLAHLAIGVGCYFIAKFLKRKYWEVPSSLL